MTAVRTGGCRAYARRCVWRPYAAVWPGDCNAHGSVCAEVARRRRLAGDGRGNSGTSGNIPGRKTVVNIKGIGLLSGVILLAVMFMAGDAFGQARMGGGHGSPNYSAAAEI